MPGENVIDSIGGQIYLDRESLLICDFDHPTRNDCNKIGSPVPRPLEYICSGGDSGGGLFRNKNNAWELIGICSGSGVDINQLMKSGYYGHTMEGREFHCLRIGLAYKQTKLPVTHVWRHAGVTW
ncbi:MAG: hypothetical protein IPN15_22450 [Saprospiraceae bacterium]|nr:hypothetical protein [Candidatus Vicinibacter affinis]